LTRKQNWKNDHARGYNNDIEKLSCNIARILLRLPTCCPSPSTIKCYCQVPYIIWIFSFCLCLYIRYLTGCFLFGLCHISSAWTSQVSSTLRYLLTLLSPLQLPNLCRLLSIGGVFFVRFQFYGFSLLTFLLKWNESRFSKLTWQNPTKKGQFLLGYQFGGLNTQDVLWFSKLEFYWFTSLWTV
jgi:hypothetical protein